MRCKSSAVNCLIRTASISDTCEGNDTGFARTEKSRLPYGCRAVAVGETWVANKPGGLNIRNSDDLDTPSAVQSLERIVAGGRPIGGTWGRPMTSGKQQA